MTSLATNLKDAVGQFPDHPALRLDEVMLTYRDLDEAASRVAGFLQQEGIEPGDAVGLMMPNVVAFPVMYYGILRAGGVVVPMNSLLKKREIEHYLGDSGARLLFVWETAVDEATAGAEAVGARCVPIGPDSLDEIAHWPAASDDVPREDGDTAVLLYTSGTTGSPKGARLSHANLRANASVSATSLFQIGPDDVVFGGLPLFHAFGQTCAMNAAVAGGACLTLLTRFDPDKALEIIARDKVTVFEGVPTMYVALLHTETGADTSTLRVCASGGAALPGEVLSSFEEKFEAKILEGYGLSETSPLASFNSTDRKRVGSIGTPIEGVEMKIVDENDQEVAHGEIGEIVIKGHNIMSGYHNRPEATEEAIRDGWFHSGDMGRQDEDGFFFIVDRKKELIIRGGFNVYPREIEEVLYEHPQVKEAAVIGVPDDRLGEEIAAAVSLRADATVTAQELQDYVKDAVAAYKYPRTVWITDELPKGPTGKILKRMIVPPEENED